MTLSLEEVEHIAELARLSLTDEEKVRFREQLSTILDYAARLQALDTDDVPPMATVLPFDTILRDDVIRPGLDRDDLLVKSDDTKGGMFRVEIVLD